MAATKKLSRLEFAIGIKDAASSRLGKVMQSLDKMTKHVPQQFKDIGASALGAWGSIKGIEQIVAPAREFNKSLGGIQNLGVADDALKHLGAEAKKFAAGFGGSATDVVQGAIDIQKSMHGLQGNELGRISKASAILAKATKEDMSATSGYITAMYGSFQRNADKMGKVRWAEQLAGQTALARELFKVDSSSMQAAFGSLGKSASRMNVSQAEQMAVLGSAATTMGGAGAGQGYKDFLAGASKAQVRLGVKFTDDGGAMLSMDKILANVEAKFGKDVSSDVLAKAFGSAEAGKLVKALMQDTQGLAKNINALGNVTGLDKASSMARKSTDAFDRARGITNAVAVSFGQILLPPVEKVVDIYNTFMGKLDKYMKLAPNLTKLIGKVAIGILTVTAVLGALSAAMGAAKMASLALKLTFGPFGKGLLGLGKGFLFIIPKVWAFTAALLANPIAWIVLAIIGFIAVIALLIYYWDDLVTAFKESDFGQGVMAFFDGIGEAINWFIDLISGLPGFVAKIFKSMMEFILAPILKLADGIIWIGKKIGVLDEDFGEVAIDIAAMPDPVDLPPSLAANRGRLPQGGIQQELEASQAKRPNSQDNSVTIGEQHIHVEKKMDEREMQEMLQMELA